VTGKAFFSFSTLALTALMATNSRAQSAGRPHDDTTILSVVARSFCAAYPSD
jgi:hypothetical protein